MVEKHSDDVGHVNDKMPDFSYHHTTYYLLSSFSISVRQCGCDSKLEFRIITQCHVP